MKKYFLSIVALVVMLFATSCQESLVEPQLAGPTTFTVQLPDQMGTKAFGDESSTNATINKLYVQVYSEDGNTLVYQPSEPIAVTGGSASFSVNLIQDQKYDIIFWAQKDAAYTTTNLKSIPMDKIFHNVEDGAAFFAFLDDFVPTGTSQPVTLKRPFAQLNLGTTPASLKTDVKADSVRLVQSYIKVSNVASSFSPVSGYGVGETQTMEFTLANVPTQKLYVSGEMYYYVSMDYLPIAGDDQALVTVDATINTSDGNITHTFTNVPVKENYRTNIIGNLISSTTDFVVTIEEGFVDENGNPNPDNDYFVVDNVAEAHKALLAGETYIAINSIRNGESVLNLDNTLNTTLYIQLPDTDASLTIKGDNVQELYLSVPDTNPNNDGLTLSINTPNAHVVLNGQVYDAPFISTSSSTLVLDGVKITKSVTVEQGNVVVGEGTEIRGNEQGSQIISVSDEAIVIINGTQEEIRVEGDDVVVVEGTQDEINVSNVSELRAAVNTIDAGGVINITKNIDGVNGVILIDKNITINGDDKSISGNASRIFRICSSELNVEMNDLNIVSTAVRIGTNDIRGISLDADLKNVTLTLNNCSVDFEDNSASDWSYGVNFTGGTTNTLIINRGEYEGANAINLRGDEHEISIEEAELTSIYSYNDMYFGQCIRLDGTGSVVNVKNTIFNGDHAVAIGGKSENEITVEGNTDNTKYAKVKAGDKYCYSLEEAIGSIESEGVIKLLFSFESDPVTIPNGKTITLNLNGKIVTAVDNSTGSYGLITNKANLTIVGPGTISLSATNDRDWNAYSSVISNNPGGNLTVGKDVVIEHLGGTDMAYGIDNLTNGKNTSAITTIDGATVKSTYRAIRQFLNGIEATNELYVKAGSTILNTTGTNKGIWMQDPSKNANTGKLVVEEGAHVDDVYLDVTEGSTEWPVEVSVVASSLNEGKTVIYENVPAGYEVVEVDGVWKVISYVKVASWADLTAALEANQTELILLEDITYDANYQLQKDVTINLNGKSMTLPMINIHTKTTVKNGTINGKVYARKNSDIVFDNVKFSGAVSDNLSTEGHLAIQSGCKLYVKDCLFSPTSVSGSQTKPISFEGGSSFMKFENCEFKSSPYKKQVYFNSLSATATLDFINCNFNNKTPNIMFAAACPLTNFTMNGTTKLASVTLETNRAKDAVTDEDLAYLREMIENNSISSVRLFYAGGSSEYIR